MKLLIVSHKLCWKTDNSPSGFATTGGFPFQIQNLSSLFEQTTLMIPVINKTDDIGLIPLTGKNLNIVRLSSFGIKTFDHKRKIYFPFWLALNIIKILYYILFAEAVHTPVPSDVGQVALVIAHWLKKPLFIRYGGNWLDEDYSGRSSNLTGKHAKWFIKKYTGGRIVSFATGMRLNAPWAQNPDIKWIFSTTLTQQELNEYGKIEHKFNNSQLRLIFVGRLERAKGVQIAINALEYLRERIPSAQLVIVGDGTFRQELNDIVNQKNLSGNVFFRGQLSHEDVISELKRSDIFVFPTMTEGFPKAVVEAMACGLPVIASNVSVLPYLVDDTCGRIVLDVNPKNVADAICQCAQDPSMYKKMSKSVIERARKYSLENWSEQISTELETKWKRKLC